MPATMTREKQREAITFDREEFKREFNHAPFIVKHHLSDHPLFELPRLIELSKSLPADRVEYNAGNVPITLDPTNTPRTGLSVEETIRRIEECRSWMVLKNVEQDPDYHRLLGECLDPMLSLIPDMRGREAFVFISSPGAVTPFHIDPECNFLLQIRGLKRVRMFPMNDPELLTEEELELFYAGGTRNLPCRDEEGKKARIFELNPGDGLHFPVTMPHWVENGPNVSISFSVTFRTHESDRREILYRVNHRLRKAGLKPTPVGQSSFKDGVKYFVFDAARKLKHAMGSKEEHRREY
ncbi:transcription factor [bacterium]|nr:transcription factor [bacterium]